MSGDQTSRDQMGMEIKRECAVGDQMGMEIECPRSNVRDQMSGDQMSRDQMRTTHINKKKVKILPEQIPWQNNLFPRGLEFDKYAVYCFLVFLSVFHGVQSRSSVSLKFASTG